MRRPCHGEPPRLPARRSGHGRYASSLTQRHSIVGAYLPQREDLHVHQVVTRTCPGRRERRARCDKMSAMRFQRTATYDAAPAEVFAMLSDPAWRAAVGAAQGVTSQKVTVTPEGDGCRIVIDELQNTAGLPAIAKKIAGETTRAVVTEVWSSPTSGTVEIVAPGKPTKMVGTTRLVADGDRTQQVTELECTVKVPLISGKLEQLMVDNINAGRTVEETVGAAWLKGER
ncbi:DUF2505 domain-containing protein [Nocardioides humilatus]|uniref:DUF2505 domain-containing protein n=2 Tax=Nocardioides humilatus TaxID=2607660 RepID=A0A5B1LES1_9ACTN|nr:DUF2505 domain-containing protein [Nocardioides humilatus]